jgi:hypothetical protein
MQRVDNEAILSRVVGLELYAWQYMALLSASVLQSNTAGSKEVLRRHEELIQKYGKEEIPKHLNCYAQIHQGLKGLLQLALVFKTVQEFESYLLLA